MQQLFEGKPQGLSPIIPLAASSPPCGERAMTTVRKAASRRRMGRSVSKRVAVAAHHNSTTAPFFFFRGHPPTHDPARSAQAAYRLRHTSGEDQQAEGG